MKKLFSCFLMLVTLFTAMSLNTFALTEGAWEYKILNNEVILTKYIGTDTEVVVPSTIRGCPIVGLTINNTDFAPNITSLTLPESLRELGDEALLRCINLQHMNFPKSLNKVGKSSMVSPKIKFADLSNVEHIGISAFNQNRTLEEVILSNKLSDIPLCAFQFTSLKKLIIPESVKTIGEHAFAATALENVIIPGSVETVGACAFAGCENLKEVVICYGVKSLPSAKVNGQGTFTYNPSLESIYIPSSVTTLSKLVTLKSDNAIVYCAEDSYAESFCKKNNISYIIDNSVDTQINVLKNGSRISFHNYGQNPTLINGRTLVPLRAIFESLNATVEWDDSTQTVIAIKGSTKTTLQIGSNKMYVNGQEKVLDVPAQLINDRTMVPVRAIAEAFDCTVDWESNSKTVLIIE